MSLKKYLSKNLIMRLCLLLLMVGAAALFDMYHGANKRLGEITHKTPASQETGNNKTFFCNQVPTYNLKTTATALSIRFRNIYTQDKFLLRYYNLRTFQHMKAETIQISFSARSFHSLPFNRVLYTNPDDTPPFS